MNNWLHRIAYGACSAAALAGVHLDALGQGFGMHVSPPRFELKGAPGDKLREVIEITNPEVLLGRYAAYTADWRMNEKGEIGFYEGPPQAGSCRPWVRIERRKFTVAASSSRSFRFEIHVPPDAATQECRFAIMVGSDPDSDKDMKLGQLNVPIGGQIAVIVYVAIGSAKANLKFRGLRKGVANSVQVPVAVFENVGNAHGRPEGSLTAKDRAGTEFEAYVNSIPILPGQTREAPIYPSRSDAQGMKFDFPVLLKGTIEWDGGKQEINETVK